ncbi:MAG: hypothetical protein COC12_04975 [Rhodobacteraceae bacterium]|nr:MAG: hypothetical protein COC12_04975 [Paracoccaceae bacterium]
MSDAPTLDQMIADILTELRTKLGVRSKDLAKALAKTRHRLPRRVYRQGMTLVKAQPLAAHPRLRLTLDIPTLQAAATEVTTHLASIDVGERRKSWLLGMLGGLSFNLILMGALLIGFLIWREIL